MKADIWERIDKVLDEALGFDPPKRQVYLHEIGEREPEVRREVEALLGCEDQSERFLQNTATSYSEGLIDETSSALVGQTVGRYRIICELGSGGMGSVFLGERTDGEFQQKVAVKVVRPGVDTAEVRRRFLDERQILANLEHPNIARLIDGGTTDDGMPFLVMEHVEGVPVTEYCSRKGVTTRERLLLFQQICQAVAFAHSNLVIHRDLKPSNLFVTADGTPKLLDFGLAKILDINKSSSETATNFRALTPAYASPEQIRGEAITTASDVYSLGVVLYELLTGTRPFDFDSMSLEKMIEVVTGSEPDKPSSVSPRSLSGDLDNIVLMAMRREPERRYRSVDQLASDIQRHLNGLPIVATEDKFLYRTSKFIRRHRIGIAAAALIMITLIAGIIATTWQMREARREQAKAEKIRLFLQNMLGSAAPEIKGADITIRDALDEASLRARVEFVDSPDVLAEVLMTIGKTYVSLTLNDKAETDLREAVALSRLVNGENHVTTAGSMAWLGLALVYQNKAAEGVEISRLAVDLNRALHPNGHEDVGVALFAYAFNLIRGGKSDEALPIAYEASQTIRSSLGESHGYYLATLSLLGLAHQNQGNKAEAERLFRDVIARGSGIERRFRIYVAQSASYLGTLLIEKKEFEEAEKVIRQSEALYREILGESNASIAATKLQLGTVLIEKSDFANAESELRESLLIFKNTLPEGNPYTTQASSILGLALTRGGRPVDGEPYLRDALAARSATLSPTHQLVVETKLALAENLAEQRKVAESETLLTSVLDLQESQSPINETRIAETKQRIANIRSRRPPLIGSK